jgi:hypothetical protein
MDTGAILPVPPKSALKIQHGNFPAFRTIKNCYFSAVYDVNQG